MTKTVTRAMAVNALLHRFATHGTVDVALEPGRHFIPCAICGEPLLPEQAIEFDHTHADVHGGPHEYRNLRPLHKDCHKKKTKADVQAQAKGDRILGLTKNNPKAKIRSPGFSKSHKPMIGRFNG